MKNSQDIQRNESVQHQILTAQSLEDLKSLLIALEGFQPQIYKLYDYLSFGGKPVHPEDISYFLIYENYLVDIENETYDIISWDTDNILFLFDYGVRFDRNKGIVVLVDGNDKESFELLIAERQYVEKFNVEVACPFCGYVNKILPSYKIDNCYHLIVAHIYGDLIWNIENAKFLYESQSVILDCIADSNDSDDNCAGDEFEDEDGNHFYWTISEVSIRRMKLVFPGICLRERRTYGLGFDDVAGFAFLPDASIAELWTTKDE